MLECGFIVFEVEDGSCRSGFGLSPSLDLTFCCDFELPRPPSQANDLVGTCNPYCLRSDISDR